MTADRNLSVLVNVTFATRFEHLRNNSPKFIVLHSTENFQSYASLYHLHKDIYGWCGIGYHVFVSKGRAYQARDFDLEGAHCVGLNFNSIGVCMFSKNHSIAPADLDMGKKVINEIHSRYGPLPLISHTHGQIRYINKLCEAKGLATGVSEDVEISSHDQFLNIKEKLLDFSNLAHLEAHPYLNMLIDSFKKCPSEEFYDFIKEANRNGQP